MYRLKSEDSENTLTKFINLLLINHRANFNHTFTVKYVKTKSDLRWQRHNFSISKEEFVYKKTFTEKKQTNRHKEKMTMCYKSSYTIQKRRIFKKKKPPNPSLPYILLLKHWCELKQKKIKKHNHIYMPLLQKLNMVTYTYARGRSIVKKIKTKQLLMKL